MKLQSLQIQADKGEVKPTGTGAGILDDTPIQKVAAEYALNHAAPLGLPPPLDEGKDSQGMSYCRVTVVLMML